MELQLVFTSFRYSNFIIILYRLYVFSITGIPAVQLRKPSKLILYFEVPTF
jgi:hypothetical protein